MTERTYSTKCTKCRERAVVLAPVSYSTQVDYEGQKHQVAIPNLIVPRCAKCGTFSLHHDAIHAIEAACRMQLGLLSPEVIQRYRTALGLSQQELADAIGVPVDMLCRWEDGGQFQQRCHDKFLRAFFKVPELRVALANHQTLQFSEAAAPIS